MNFKRKIVKVTPLLATVAFLMLGFLAGKWHPGWLVFLAIPLVGIVDNMTSKNVKAKIQSLTTIAVVIAFFILGFYWNAWHPGWLVFFAIPIVSTLLYG